MGEPTAAGKSWYGAPSGRRHLHASAAGFERAELHHQHCPRGVEPLGGQEVLLPLAQPASLWRKSGRYDTVDDTLVRCEHNTYAFPSWAAAKGGGQAQVNPQG